MSTADARRGGSGVHVVVAGPSSTLTVPGNMASQIVSALADRAVVTRIEVNSSTDFDAGLHRVPSLAAAHDWARLLAIPSHEAPDSPRLRARAFREWVDDDVELAVAFLWPGLDASWVRTFFQAANRVGAYGVALCASLPRRGSSSVANLAGALAQADRIVVGDDVDRRALQTSLGRYGPPVLAHPALRLTGRPTSGEVQQLITAFLPRDDERSLRVLLAAFDAIPDAWVSGYLLRVVMRHESTDVASLVAQSHHASHVELVGETLDDDAVRSLNEQSSAIILADPAVDSRAFSIAIHCGVATVVLTSATVPDVGNGYVGGLLADQELPVSVHVALHHALRLAGLQFPSPGAWDDLAWSLIGVSTTPPDAMSAEPALSPRG